MLKLGHPIDFTELQANEAGKGSGLENMACRILSKMGLDVSYRGVGIDDGCDILAIGEIKNPISSGKRRWIIECKDKSISKKAVSKSEIGIVDHCFAHECDSYLLVTTTQPSAGLVAKMNRITQSKEHNIIATFWNREKLIELLFSEEFEDVLREYLPNSYRNIKELDSSRSFRSGKLRWRDTFDEVIDLLELRECPTEQEREEAYTHAFEQIESSEIEVVDAVIDTMNDSQLLEEMAILLIMMAQYSKNHSRRVFAIENLRYYELLDLHEVIPYLMKLPPEYQRSFFEQEGIEEVVGGVLDEYFANGAGYNTICDISHSLYVEEIYINSLVPSLENNRVKIVGEFTVSLMRDNSSESDLSNSHSSSFYDSKRGTYSISLNSYEDIKLESISLPFGEPDGT